MNKFDTIAVHGGYNASIDTKCASPSIHPTTAYLFENAEHARSVFSLEEAGNIYSRLTNPTNDVLEQRIALLEGGVGAISFASGHAAIAGVVFALASAGDEVVSSNAIYGGAVNLLGKSISRLGIKVHFNPPDDYEGLERLINDKTKMIFAESIGNPNANVIDIEKYAQIANKYGIPLVIDSTFATPYLQRPIEFGADIVVHSATKYLSGHGNAMMGIVVDSGKFKFEGNPRFKEFNEPDESYHGIVYARDCKELALTTKLRAQILRDFGACASPFNSYLTLLGVETLSLRMQKHCENAVKVAKFLESHKKVERVNYPALQSSKYYSLTQKYLPKGCASIFTFDLVGGKNAGVKFIEALELFRHVANVGDARSLVTHPASTTHSQLSAKQLSDADITEGTIRLSIGIEDAEDIIRDLEKALG